MVQPIDLTGHTYGRLTVLYKEEMQTKNSKWVCQCACGKVVSVFLNNLRRGLTTSCGCYHKDIMTTHGLANHPHYRRWKLMLYRCYNPEVDSYPNYGGRGIEVCERWRTSLENFIEDMGECPENYTLERLDNDGDYEPDNCVWASKEVQCSNTSRTRRVEYRGVLYTLSQLSRLVGISHTTLSNRMRTVSVEEAVSTPLRGEFL